MPAWVGTNARATIHKVSADLWDYSEYSRTSAGREPCAGTAMYSLSSPLSPHDVDSAPARIHEKVVTVPDRRQTGHRPTVLRIENDQAGSH